MSIHRFKKCIDEGDTLGAVLALSTSDVNSVSTILNVNTPLTYATMKGSASVVAALLDMGVDVDAVGPGEFAPLHIAADRMHSGLIPMLLEAGANIHARSDDGYTPLHCAACSGDLEALQMLLDAESIINSQDKYEQWTPLHHAVYEGHEEIVKVLLERGADPTIRDVDNEDVRNIAVRAGHVNIVAILEQFSKPT